MWSLAKGYMERRNMYEVGYNCSWKYLQSTYNNNQSCDERKQCETSFFYSLDMLWRNWRHVTMQANHWRHPHFRWRCVLSLNVLLMIIMLRMCLKTRFIVKHYKTQWNIDFFSLYLWWQDCCHTELFFLGSSIFCAYRWIFKRNTAISMITIDKTISKHMKIM